MEFVVKEVFSVSGLENWFNQHKEQIIEWQVLPTPNNYRYMIIAKLRKEEN